MTIDKTRWQEFNQLLSQKGLPAVLLDSATTAAAEEMDEILAGPEGYFDAHPITRAISDEMIKCCRQGDVDYDTRWSVDFDESRPETMARYYALAYASTTLIPLDDLTQWELVADTLFPDPRCDVHLLHDCYRLRDRGEYLRAETVSMKRGEIICLFNICDMCLESLRWITFKSPEYGGPHPWTDEGKRGDDPSAL
ncbi:hypothetical protein [Mycolicibacterium stellerae]|uniref:hypothetical protein n=1 Tax=Mycolicibacterium stellerae TaxID=2358193 RepID=UPI000F0B214D|nr:hypothetical protein [Mycolicibacterium stellerae]